MKFWRVIGIAVLIALVLQTLLNGRPTVFFALYLVLPHLVFAFCHLTIIFVVVGHHDRDRLAAAIGSHAGFLSSSGWATGKVMINVEPSSSLLVAVIVPRCRSTILRAMASPMPVPSYSLRPCSR